MLAILKNVFRPSALALGLFVFLLPQCSREYPISFYNDLHDPAISIRHYSHDGLFKRTLQGKLVNVSKDSVIEMGLEVSYSMDATTHSPVYYPLKVADSVSLVLDSVGYGMYRVIRSRVRLRDSLYVSQWTYMPVDSIPISVKRYSSGDGITSIKKVLDLGANGYILLATMNYGDIGLEVIHLDTTLKRKWRTSFEGDYYYFPHDIVETSAGFLMVYSSLDDRNSTVKKLHTVMVKKTGGVAWSHDYSNGLYNDFLGLTEEQPDLYQLTCRTFQKFEGGQVQDGRYSVFRFTTAGLKLGTITHPLLAEHQYVYEIANAMVTGPSDFITAELAGSGNEHSLQMTAMSNFQKRWSWKKDFPYRSYPVHMSEAIGGGAAILNTFKPTQASMSQWHMMVAGPDGSPRQYINDPSPLDVKDRELLVNVIAKDSSGYYIINSLEGQDRFSNAFATPVITKISVDGKYQWQYILKGIADYSYVEVFHATMSNTGVLTLFARYDEWISNPDPGFGIIQLKP